MSLLDKYKKGTVEGVATTTTTPNPVPEPASTKPVNAISSRLAKLAESKGKRIVQSPQQVAQQAAKQQDLITKAATEIPENIFTLNEAVNKIEGFNAEQFSTLLASTYRSLINDEPDLPKLMKAIDTNLRQYEELTYLLTPEQLGMYFDVLMKQKDIHIKATAPKKTTASITQKIEREGGLDLSL